MFRKSLELIPGMLQAGFSKDGIEGKCRRSTGFGSFHELCCIRFFVFGCFYCYRVPPLSEGKSKKVRLNCNDDLLPFSLWHIYSKPLEFHNAYAHVIYRPACTPVCAAKLQIQQNHISIGIIFAFAVVTVTTGNSCCCWPYPIGILQLPLLSDYLTIEEG